MTDVTEDSIFEEEDEDEDTNPEYVACSSCGQYMDDDDLDANNCCSDCRAANEKVDVKDENEQI
jgi:Zn finger protein HypA/HybF involved in hydrogenase expression